MISSMMQNLNGNLLRMDQKQLQATTGKRIHKPSDDPIGISRSLKLRSDIKELEQYKKNVDDTISWLETTELAVHNVGAAVERLRELTVQASNGVLTEDETKKIKAEVVELKNQIISLGNTTYGGKYVFSGKKTDQKLFNDAGEYNVSNLSIDHAPDAIDDKIKFNVGMGETIEINVVGFELFGGDEVSHEDDVVGVEGGEQAGIIKMIEDIEAKLEAGDTAGLTDDLQNIDIYYDQYSTIRSEIGAKVNRMELVENRIVDDRLNLMELQSKIEDADVAEVYMQLMAEENVYRSSLAIGSRIIQPTLMDFLR